MTSPAPPDDDGKKSAGKRGRGAKGRFAHGNRLGPGRPKGLKNRATLIVEAMLDGDVEALTKALIKKAKAGHGTALQLVFDRIAPARRDRHVEFDLPSVQTAADLGIASIAILEAVASGGITPSEGHSVSGLLEHRRKVLEAVDLEARLQAVEERLVAKTGGK